MKVEWRRAVPAAALVGVALGASACGKAVTETTTSAPPASSAAPSSAAAASSAAATDAGAATSAAGSDTAAASGATAIAGYPAGADTILTPKPTGTLDKAVWAVYRETQTLDPIFAFDYPENTAISAMCDAVLRQGPDGTIGPGLATSADYSDPTTLVLKLRDGVTFWDGSPLTADDVVYNLQRDMDPKLGGFYTAVFARVSSITATGPLEVTIKLKQPDSWLRGELSGTPGFIVEKKYAEAKGKDFGSVKGGTMCTGPFKLSSWKTGEGVTMVKNDAYWDKDLQPQLDQLTIKGMPDDAAITAAFKTGELNGIYAIQLTTLDDLKSSGKVNVYEGPSYGADAFIVSSLKGALADKRVRQALSMAIDRPGLVAATYKGAGFPARALGNPGTWGYGKDVFTAAWNALPEPTIDIAKAKQLVKDAGAEGKTIKLGMSSELPALVTEAAAFKSAAESIGLKAELVSTSAANYINFFIDPKAREGVDGFFTGNYPDYADPAGLYGTLVLADGSQNYSGYENPKVTELMNAARSELDDTKRAQDVADAQVLIGEDVPWIPVISPLTALVMTKNITGAPATFNYMFGPWAAYLGKA